MGRSASPRRPADVPPEVGWLVRTVHRLPGLSKLKPGFAAIGLAYVSGTRRIARSHQQQQLAAGREYYAQPPASGPGVLAAERMVGMIEITHEPFPRAAEERKTAHHLVLDERTAYGAFDAEPVIVPTPSRMLVSSVLPGCRVTMLIVPPTDSSVERPLRASQDFDALDVQKIGEHHRRPSQIDAIEVNGGTRVGADNRACRCRGSSLAPRRRASTS